MSNRLLYLISLMTLRASTATILVAFGLLTTIIDRNNSHHSSKTPFAANFKKGDQWIRSCMY
jgi:hypothetical protein